MTLCRTTRLRSGRSNTLQLADLREQLRRRGAGTLRASPSSSAPGQLPKAWDGPPATRTPSMVVREVTNATARAEPQEAALPTAVAPLSAHASVLGQVCFCRHARALRQLPMHSTPEQT